MSVAEISELVGLIATGIALVGTIIAYVKKIVKDIKEKTLKAKIEEYMKQAEKSPACSSGADKLLFVLRSLYLDYGKDYEKIEEQAKSYVEECIDFSKKINAKGETK